MYLHHYRTTGVSIPLHPSITCIQGNYPLLDHLACCLQASVVDIWKEEPCTLQVALTYELRLPILLSVSLLPASQELPPPPTQTKIEPFQVSIKLQLCSRTVEWAHRASLWICIQATDTVTVSQTSVVLRSGPLTWDLFPHVNLAAAH
jgi:hypothetical protein